MVHNLFDYFKYYTLEFMADSSLLVDVIMECLAALNCVNIAFSVSAGTTLISIQLIH